MHIVDEDRGVPIQMRRFCIDDASIFEGFELTRVTIENKTRYLADIAKKSTETARRNSQIRVEWIV